KKIGALGSGSRIRHPRAEELSHLYFASGLKSSLAGVFATHPPLDERIRRIDPSFDGSYEGVLERAAPRREVSAPDRAAADRAAPDQRMAGAVLAGAAVIAAGQAGRRADVAPGTRAPDAPATPPEPPDADALVAAVGAPEPEHLDFARRLVDGLPAELRAA